MEKQEDQLLQPQDPQRGSTYPKVKDEIKDGKIIGDHTQDLRSEERSFIEEHMPNFWHSYHK